MRVFKDKKIDKVMIIVNFSGLAICNKNYCIEYKGKLLYDCWIVNNL